MLARVREHDVQRQVLKCSCGSTSIFLFVRTKRSRRAMLGRVVPRPLCFFAQAHVFRSSSLGFVSATLMFERRVCLRHERFVPFRTVFCSIRVFVSSVLRCVIFDVLYAFLCFSRLICSMCMFCF